jgi:hypothetical protein
MKTPRELLLEKHRPAEAKLAALRGEDLAALARLSSTAPPRPVRLGSRLSGAAANFWRDAIQPWSRVWAGVAAVWVAILTVNLVSADRPAPNRHASAKPDAQAQMVLAEQKQLLAQLLESTAPPPTARPRSTGPRSDLRRDRVPA